VQATPDGRFLVFASRADLTAGDTSSEPQIFEYDALEGRLVRVSTGQTGYASGMASANAYAAELPYQNSYGGVSAASFGSTTSVTGLAVSAVSEGGQLVTRVLFGSVGALTPGATVASGAGAESVYEYRSAGSIANGDVYLLSDGTNQQAALPYGLDASGVDAFIQTVDPLLAGDTDTQFDVYDARMGGGFPAPAPAVGCEGEGCQGTVSAGRAFGVAGSVGTAAGGDLPGAAEQPPMLAKPKPRPKPKPKPKAKGRRRRRRRVKRRGRGGGRKSVLAMKVRG
jgi:hypothetical protein